MLVEDHRQLVHQRDVEVALGVLDDLGGLGHLDAAGAVHAGGDRRSRRARPPLSSVAAVIAGDDLHDLGDGVFLVAGIDALRRVADVEVLLPLHAGMLFQHRNADFFGGAGIDGGFIDDDRALFHVLADRGGGTDQRREVGDVRLVDRGGHGDDDEVGLRQIWQGSVVTVSWVAAFRSFAADFAGWIAESL